MTVDGTREAHPDCAGDRRAQQARLWLGAGAMTLGMGAAMLGGAAIAAADASDAPAGPSRTGSSDSSDSSPSDAGSTSTGTTKNGGGTSRDTVGSSSDDSEDSVGSRGKDDSGEADDSDDSWGATSPTRGSGLDEADPTSEETIGGSEETVTGEVAEEVTEEIEAVDEGSPVGTGGGHESTSTPQPPAANPPTISDDSSASPSPIPDTDTTPLATPAVTDSGLSTIAGSAGASFYTLASTSSTVGRAAALSPAVVPAAAVAQASNPFGLPTPEELLRGLQELGTNLYFAVMNQLYGFQRSLTALRDDVIGILGFTQEVITRSLPFGNPAGNAQYFVQADDFLSGALATVAMAYAQLTGTTVDLPSFLAAAANTSSFSAPGTKIYLGPGVRMVSSLDSYEVLQDRDVRIIMHNYGTNQTSKAFNELSNGLADPTKVMIVPISGSVGDSSEVRTRTIVVIGVDNVNDTVTINDPTRDDGQGLVLSKDDFIKAWGNQQYTLITTQLASAANVAPEPAETRWVWSLPSIQEIGSRVAAAFVHQVQIFQENVTELSDDLSRTFGVAQPEPIGPPESGDIEYGNYLQNYQYWKHQGNFGTCALMATSAVIAQLTGKGLPVDMDALAKEVQALAEQLPSGVINGEPIYIEKNGGRGTFREDVITLLNRFGINADYTTYLKTDGSLALDNMTTALKQGQSVIVSVNNKKMYDAWNTQYFGNNWEWYPGPRSEQSNHAVTVLSVNMTKGVVYINDSAPSQGQGLAVPLDQFMKAWQTSSFALTTAELDSSAAG